MIKRVRIQNFGSLYDVDVTLGPLTILLGPNASGKTMFIRALRALAKLLRSPLREPGGSADFFLDHATLSELVANGDRNHNITFDVWLESPAGEPTYSLTLGRIKGLWSVLSESISYDGLQWNSRDNDFEFSTQTAGSIRWTTPGEPPRHACLPYLLYKYADDPVASERTEPFRALQRDFGYVWGYRVNPTDVISPTLPPWIRKQKKLYVDSTGQGFVHKLREWAQTIEGNACFRETVVRGLQEIFPHILEVGFHGEEQRLFIQYKTNRSDGVVPAQLESDGVNLSLFILAIPHLVVPTWEENPSVCLGIEEPEAGTHPFLQGERVRLLLDMARGRYTDRPIQVLASTHSVDTLRGVPPEDVVDVLRFVEHMGPERGTVIHRLTSREEVDELLELYGRDIGAAWYSGALGGVPEIQRSGDE